MNWAVQGADEAVRLTPTPPPVGSAKLEQRPGLFLVEADGPRRERLAALLEARYDVQAFTSGEQALEALARGCPHAALLARELPGLDGQELCRRLKQAAGEPTLLPVLLIIDAAGEAERARAVEAGVDDFLGTGIDAVELCARVGTSVRLSRLHREQRAAKLRLEAVRAQLEEAERLATLGTFAAGVGHELNNVTTVFTSALEELARSREFEAELIDDLNLAARRLKELAAAVQHLAQPSAREAMVDLRQVIKDVLWLTRLTGRTKYVVVDYTPPAQPIFLKLVMVELQQVVLNLVTNAADALAHHSSGRISIELGTEAGLVVLRISDNGPGFSTEAAAHVLDPHFSTKTPGLSTGLGLPVVRQLVTAWGGTVDLRSRAGTGACAEVRIPLERVNAAS
jgi:C4-dicarboxylate-specific signal transduction histidine kinase